MIRISDKSDISASDVVNEVVSRPGWAQFLPGAIPAGAQGTVRIAALLRILAANNSTGMKLHEIVSAAELEQSTAHRVLSALHSVGFVARDEEAKRYHLGPLLFELFTTAFPHFNMREICRPYIERLAEELGDTAYVMVQSGYDAICADLCQGNHPIRTCTVSVGQRRPLGLGCGSLCVLAHLSDQEYHGSSPTTNPGMRPTASPATSSWKGSRRSASSDTWRRRRSHHPTSSAWQFRYSARPATPWDRSA